jgi:hypothetical protein
VDVGLRVSVCQGCTRTERQYHDATTHTSSPEAASSAFPSESGDEKRAKSPSSRVASVIKRGKRTESGDGLESDVYNCR